MDGGTRPGRHDPPGPAAAPIGRDRLMIVTRTAVAAFLAALALVVAGCTNTSASHRASRLPPPPPPASPARDPYQRQVTATTFTLKLTGAGEVPPAARHGS